MKVSREQAAENRRRIVETAGRLFRENGYDGIGVADIMKHAGLTHGGFYGHFASKDDLAVEASAQALASKAGVWDLGETAPGDAAEPALARFLATYLSPNHRDDLGNGCALAALGADAAREPAAVRGAFTAAVRTRLEKLMAMLPGRNPAARRRRAIAALASAVGALVLARAVADPELSAEILSATKDALISG
jgi:TetR/AcrR family transcriptional regulator, transcriptional repressor for nem operon